MKLTELITIRLEQLPSLGWLQLVTECTPLFHGVALLRALNEGVIGPGLLVHAALVALTIAACAAQSSDGAASTSSDVVSWL